MTTSIPSGARPTRPNQFPLPFQPSAPSRQIDLEARMRLFTNNIGTQPITYNFPFPTWPPLPTNGQPLQPIQITPPKK